MDLYWCPSCNRLWCGITAIKVPHTGVFVGEVKVTTARCERTPIPFVPWPEVWAAWWLGGAVAVMAMTGPPPRRNGEADASRAR